MKKVMQSKSNAKMERSSRSAISSMRINKKNIEEQSNQELQCPYFRKDKVGDRMLQRNIVDNQLSNGNVHLDNAQKIVKSLISRNKQAKEKLQKLQKLRQQQQKKQSEQCPFAPLKKKLDRYRVDGDVVRRSEIWLQEKKRKQLQLKQQKALQDLKHCTFSPTFESRRSYKSQSSIKSKYLTTNKSIKQNIRLNLKLSVNQSLSNTSERKEFTKQQYQILRKNLIFKLRNTLQ